MNKILEAAIYLGKKFSGELEAVRNLKNSDDASSEFIIYQCRECGYWSKSLAFLHGHMEQHTGFLSVADIEKFTEMTRKIVVESFEVVEVSDLSEENL